MALDLNSVQVVRPRLAPVTEVPPVAPVSMPIDLNAVTTVPPTYPSANVLPPLAGAGVQLTKMVLFILSCALAVLLGALILQEYQIADARSTINAAAGEASHPLSVEQINARQDLMKEYAAMVAATRDFWAKTAQMILLNLLLPVLTALLGYVFGSKAEK